jgi:hypothetical protein
MKLTSFLIIVLQKENNQDYIAILFNLEYVIYRKLQTGLN